MSQIVLSLYSVLIYIARPIAVLAMIWRSKADPAYRQRLAERFAYQSIPLQANGGIIVHAVSMGEVVAATPLIEQLLSQHPHVPLTVTCTTPTGSARIKAAFGDRVFHYYLPFDSPGAVRRFLNKLQPQLVVLLETELWPNLIWQAHSRQIRVAVVNARLSEKSARGYQRFSALVRPMLNKISAVYCQDQASTERFLALGAHAFSTGNLKFDMQIADSLATRAAELLTAWQIGVEKFARPVFVAGSTHAGEDEQVLAAFAKVLVTHSTALLILVPRHPDRFETVAQLISASGLQFVKRSEQKAVTANTQVLLGDTMGELMLWYQLADVVFIGGSLITRGGHNPLEAMCLAKPVVSGRHVFNFATVYADLQQAEAVVWVEDANSLAKEVHDLFASASRRQQLAEAGFGLYQHHGGATARLTAALAPWVTPLRCEAFHDTQLWFHAELVEVAPEQLFHLPFWQAEQAVMGHSTGRNTVWFVQQRARQHDLQHDLPNLQQWVMRHYYRGGLIGKLFTDWFWRQPITKTRAMAEFTMLRQMQALGLPVPTPIAARYQARTLGYSADIMIARIPDAVDLFHYLQNQPLGSEQWQQLGQVIAKFHQAGVYHSDLNCHNILFDNQQFWLIDFDKCGWNAAPVRQQEMLDRLLRSLVKEQRKAQEQAQSFYFSPDDFVAFRQGYQRYSAKS